MANGTKTMALKPISDPALLAKLNGQTGQLSAGNINLHNRPIHKNPDGSISTVRSASYGIDRKTVLLPTVADDGSNDPDPVATYKKTGKHLGIFDTPEHATAYSQQLHLDQEKEYSPRRKPVSDPALLAQLSKQSNPAEYDPESEAFKAKYGATSGMSGIQKFLAGTGRGMMNIGRNLGNVVGLVDDQTIRDANQRDSDLLSTGAGMAGNFLGETAILTPLTLGYGAGANALRAGGTAARVLANPITRGVIEGGAQGAISAGPDNRAQGAFVGGITGSALPFLGKGIGKVARGMKRTPEAQRLLDEGISLTPGQMNPKGMFNHAEEAMQSAPLVGSVIRNARQSAEEQFQRAAIQRGSFTPLRKVGSPQEHLDRAYDSFEPLYDQVKGIAMQAPSDTDITRAVSNINVFADDAAREKVAKFVNNQVTALKTQTPDSADLLKIRTNIRRAAREADRDPAKAAEAQLLNEVEKTFTDTIQRQLTPDAHSALRRADLRYGVHKITEKAVAKGRDRPGGFTPTMLSQAIKESTDAGAYARGGGRLRDLSQAAAATFDVKSPPTGARLGVLGALGGASYFNPSTVLPIVGSILGLAGTQTGRKLAAGQTAGQKLLSKQLEKLGALTPERAQELLSIYSRGLLTSSAVTSSAN